jgi:hypothetical protein
LSVLAVRERNLASVDDFAEFCGRLSLEDGDPFELEEFQYRMVPLFARESRLAGRERGKVEAMSPL